MLDEDGDEPCLRTDGSSVFLDANKLDVDLLHDAHITQKTCALVTTSDLELGPRCSEAASSKVLNFLVACPGSAPARQN